MPGGTRIGRPSSAVTLVAVIVILQVLAWVLAAQLGWLR